MENDPTLLSMFIIHIVKELKFGQVVVVVAGTRNPKARPNRPIGGATAQTTQI